MRVSLLGMVLLTAACSADNANNSDGGSGGATTASGSSGGTSPLSTSGGAPANTGGKGQIDDVTLDPAAGGTAGEVAEPQVCAVAIWGDPGSNPAADFAEWIQARGPVVERFPTGASLENLTAATLSQFEVVLLDGLPDQTVVGISPQELESWVKGGGRLIALSGYADFPEALTVQNELLASLSLGFVTSDVLGGPVVDFVVHPITYGLTNISFIGGREVQSLPTDQVLMTVGSPARPVGVAALREDGKAFVFGDEWITFDSEWSTIPEIETFWVNIFNWLGDCKLEPIIR